ncbi:MAG: hypothetical protein WCF18_05910 [Chthoniobacteraceae bacterium]
MNLLHVPLSNRAIRLLVLGFAALLLPRRAPAGIDLTPRFIDTYIEGAVFHRLYFTDGEQKFVVSLNRETEVTPDSGGALFRFRKVPDATFLVVRSRMSPSDKFEGAALERYRESAKRLLPVLGRGSAIREEIPSPFPINGWASYRIVLTFDIGAVRHVQSVTFLNLNDADQVALITSAPEQDFDEAAHRSYQIFRTWQPMLPGDEKPALGN